MGPRPYGKGKKWGKEERGNVAAVRSAAQACCPCMLAAAAAATSGFLGPSADGPAASGETARIPPVGDVCSIGEGDCSGCCSCEAEMEATGPSRGLPDEGVRSEPLEARTCTCPTEKLLVLGEGASAAAPVALEDSRRAAQASVIGKLRRRRYFSLAAA